MRSCETSYNDQTKTHPDSCDCVWPCVWDAKNATFHPDYGYTKYCKICGQHQSEHTE